MPKPQRRPAPKSARGRVAQSVNSEHIWLHWQIGARLRAEVLKDQRAAYGEQLVDAVARSLTAEYGRGFSKRTLYYMMRFAKVFPDTEIVHAVRAQLSWTHLRKLIAIDDPLKRQFYTELCRLERWITRTLKDKMDGMLYERTAIAKRPAHVGRFDVRDKGQLELYLRWLDRHERQL